MKTLVEEVRDYALAHYEKDGWDVLIECWSDGDIRAAIGSARTTDGAIKKARAYLAPFDEQRRSVRNEAF